MYFRWLALAITTTLLTSKTLKRVTQDVLLKVGLIYGCTVWNGIRCLQLPKPPVQELSRHERIQTTMIYQSNFSNKEFNQALDLVIG